MTILEVTPDDLVEHVVFPGEELHPRLNTVEARRFIGGLANGERKRFESLVDADGNTDYREQENYMIHKWTITRDDEALVGHTTTRALQSVRYFFESNLTDDTDEHILKPFYFPLLPMPKAPHIADMHWEKQDRFRRGISAIMAGVTALAKSDVQPLHIVRGEAIQESQYRKYRQVVQAGRVVMQNTIQLDEDGQPLGSRYVFAVTPRSHFSTLLVNGNSVRVQTPGVSRLL